MNARAGGRYQIERVTYSHDALIDAIIAQPGVTQNRLAEQFGYSAAWISIVVGSDAFQMRLAERKAELIDPMIVASVEDKFKALSHRSLDILLEKLEAPAMDVESEVALRCAALGAKAMGLGGNAPARTVVLNQEGRLESLAGKLTNLLAEKRGEAQYVEAIETRR